MNTQELIPVFASEIDGEFIRLVNARELHAFLAVGKDFSNWIKDVFGNKDLAEEIYVIREPKQTQLIILKHIAKNKRG